MNTKQKVNAFIKVFNLQADKLSHAFFMNESLDGSGELSSKIYDAIYSTENTDMYFNNIMRNLHLSKTALKNELIRRAKRNDLYPQHHNQYDYYLCALYQYSIL